jgi:hypothetical protein
MMPTLKKLVMSLDHQPMALLLRNRMAQVYDNDRHGQRVHDLKMIFRLRQKLTLNQPNLRLRRDQTIPQHR